MLQAGVASLSAGCFWAFLNILWLTNSTRLLWDWQEFLLLFAAVALSGFLVAIAPAMILHGYLKPFWAGILANLVLYGAEWWFRAPPPHTVVEGWRGSILGAVGLLCVVFLLGRLLRYARARRLSLALLLSCSLWPLIVQETMEVPSGSGKGPDVVLVTVDTLRADHVAPWSKEVTSTSTMERLASGGVLFERALAPIAVTGPSHAAMLSGAGPWRSGMLLNGVSIPEEQPLLAEMLAAEGYQTGAFVSAYVLDGDLGFQRGFQVYDDDFGGILGWARSGPGRLHAMIQRNFSPSHIVERRGDITMDRAMAWMDSDAEGPTFLWVHLFDPHGPYLPPAPFDAMHYTGDPRASEHRSMEGVKGIPEYLAPSLDGIRDVDWVLAQYAGEVSFVDQQIGRLVEYLEAKGTLDNTVFVVAGDHGESLGENDVWFNHGGDLDTSALHVPFLVHWPAHIDAGQVVKQRVGVVDVAPTIMGLLSKSSSSLDGRDLSAKIREGTDSQRGPVRSICYDREMNKKERSAGSISMPTYLLARSWGESGWLQIGTHPLRGAIQNGTVDQQVIQDLPVLLGSLGAGVHTRSTQRDDDTVRRLRSLGYVE